MRMEIRMEGLEPGGAENGLKQEGHLRELVTGEEIQIDS